jgi:hypothetical protein
MLKVVAAMAVAGVGIAMGGWVGDAGGVGESDEGVLEIRGGVGDRGRGTEPSG